MWPALSFLICSQRKPPLPWTFDTVTDLARRMEQKVAAGFRVSARTAPLVVEALKHYAREHFGETPRGYTVDVWDPTGNRVEIHYASVADLGAARAAYDRAIAQHAMAPVTLRQGIRVIAETRGSPS